MEVVCLLSKLHAKQNIEVELEMSEMDLTAAESKATYEEIKDYVLGHSGLKVSSLYIAQIKEKCGIIERKNENFYMSVIDKDSIRNNVISLVDMFVDQTTKFIDELFPESYPANIFKNSTKCKQLEDKFNTIIHD